jgi:hypothetical protein
MRGAGIGFPYHIGSRSAERGHLRILARRHQRGIGKPRPEHEGHFEPHRINVGDRREHFLDLCHLLDISAVTPCWRVTSRISGVQLSRAAFRMCLPLSVTRSSADGAPSGNEPGEQRCRYSLEAVEAGADVGQRRTDSIWNAVWSDLYPRHLPEKT